MFTDFSERGRERERETEVRWLLPIRAPTEDWNYNPGKCPDQELNGQPTDALDGFLTIWDTPVRANLSHLFTTGFATGMM